MPRTPRETAVAALTGQPPAGLVPTFELEFQLTEEFFGRRWFRAEAFANVSAAERDKLIGRIADDYVACYEALDYSILFETRSPDDEARIEVIRRVREQVGERYLYLCHGDATYGIPNGTNMVDFTVRLFEQPDEMKRAADAMVDQALERGKRLLDHGLDGFALCADYCFNTGPFLSPPMFREFVTPYLHRLVQGYRDLGAYVIKHTDGNIMPILDDLVDSGAHGLHSLDPQGSVDIAEVKRLVGELEAMQPGDDLYDAKVTVLAEYVKHHVKEEETEIFPDAKRADVDLDELGERMEARAVELEGRADA